MVQFLRIVALVALMATTACTSLPTSGPTKHAVISGAEPGASNVPYELVPITLDVATTKRPETVSAGLIELGNLAAVPPPQRTDMIHVGDTLAITIYEVGITLFAPDRTVSASGNEPPAASGQHLSVKVREDGSIELPYVGTIKAAGGYPEAIAKTIRSRMRKFSESPDVEVKIADTVENTVYVSGRIARPGRYPLSPARERLLDMITLAGGPAIDPTEAELRFNRGDTVTTVRFDELTSESLANVELLPGDRIEIRKARETYTVFGAANRVAEFPFETSDITLAEAVARASGPEDAHANPRGVFLFRLEEGEDKTKPKPVVYQLNMMEPAAYFLAQMFRIQDNDVLLIANSSSNRTSKFMQMVSQLFGPLFAGVALSNALSSNNNNKNNTNNTNSSTN